MTKVLLVPIRMDAFYSDGTAKLAAPLTDFTSLPYLFGKVPPDPVGHQRMQPPPPPPPPPSGAGVQGDNVFLSETVFRPPEPSHAGEDDTWQPPAGIHLHWALPDALTAQRATSNSDGVARFPQVPNRWLLTLSTAASGAWTRKTAWVVESDYLYPAPETEPMPCGKAAISFPIVPADAFRSMLEASPPPPVHHFTKADIDAHPFYYQAPFRCMGRNKELSAWQADTVQHDYLPALNPAGLTAIGYGHPLFAAIYSNCFSVFGFNDALETATYPRRYDLIGWYDDATTDCLSLFQNLAADKDPWDALKAEYEWVDSGGAGDLPAQSIYYSRLEIHTPLSGSLPDAAASLTVGNTATEALSAYLSTTLETDPALQPLVEEQLEAMGLQPTIGVENIDLGAKFRAARHDKGFKKLHGGSLWSVRARRTTSTPSPTAEDQGGEVTLPDGLAQLLNQANLAQAAYDASWDEIDSLRRQAFADWYRLEFKYQAEPGQGPQLPSANDILAYSRSGVLTQLQEGIAGAGEVVFGKDPAGRVTVTVADSGAQEDMTVQFTLAQRLVDALDRLAQQVGAFNKGTAAGAAKIDYYLVRKGAPRFYQPADPAVLLAGAAVVATERHGADGTLACTPLDLAASGSGLTSALRSDGIAGGAFDAILAQIDVLAQAGGAGFGLQSSQPWNPVALEWTADVWPETRNTDSGPTQEGLQYAPDYLDGTYELDVDSADLKLKQRPSGLACKEATYVYSGRAILLSHAPARLRESTGAYILPLSLADLKLGGLRAQTVSDEVDFSYSCALFTWAGATFPIQAPPFLASLKDPSTLTVAQIALQQSEIATWLAAQFPFAALVNGKQELIDLAALVSAHPNWCNERPMVSDAGIVCAFGALGAAAQANDPLRTAVNAYNSVASTSFLSQALSGFNDGMLTQQREFQLPVWDWRAVALPDQRTYARDLTRNLGNVRSAPVFDGTFLPFRSGLMKVSALTLVDSFGQFLILKYGAAGKSERMTILGNVAASVGVPASIATAAENQAFIYLPPRLCQQARLNFRWLSADQGSAAGDGDEQEMNDHPATSPVCGWVLPNNLDGTLAVYDQQGTARGVLVQSNAGGQFSVVWESAPGTNNSITLSKLANPHLQDFITNLINEQGQSRAQWTSFLSNVNLALQNIDPKGFAQSSALALLMGRPMAVVRATLGIELRGLAAVDQTVPAFNDDLLHQRFKRSSNGFDAATVAVRLGEAGQLNDGLVAFWLEDGNGGFNPGSGGSAHFPELENKGSVADVLSVTPSGAPLKVTMLVDPRGTVHATCGILPVKDIAMPPDQYANVLRTLSVTFLASPILTASNRVALPLPVEAGYGWSWLDRPTGFTWNRVATIVPASRDAVYEQQRIVEGWLHLTPQAQKETT